MEKSCHTCRHNVACDNGKPKCGQIEDSGSAFAQLDYSHWVWEKRSCSRCVHYCLAGCPLPIGTSYPSGGCDSFELKEPKTINHAWDELAAHELRISQLEIKSNDESAMTINQREQAIKDIRDIVNENMRRIRKLETWRDLEQMDTRKQIISEPVRAGKATEYGMLKLGSYLHEVWNIKSDDVARSCIALMERYRRMTGGKVIAGTIAEKEMSPADEEINELVGYLMNNWGEDSLENKGPVEYAIELMDILAKVYDVVNTPSEENHDRSEKD